jgi:hypothetical protein
MAMSRKSRVALLQHEGIAAGFERLGITFEHGGRHEVLVDGQALPAFGDDGARDRADEIDGVGHCRDLIQVVDAPHEPAFEVAPGPEILDVQIANRQQSRCLGEVGTGFRPQRRPAIEGAGEKREQRSSHLLMLVLQVRFDNVETLAQPGFVGLRGFYNRQLRGRNC